MKLSFSTVGCPEWRWSEILSAASDLGYDGIEVRGIRKELYAPRIQEFSAQQAQASKATLRKLNLSISCLSTSCLLGDARVFNNSLYEGRANIDTAALMGVPYVRVFAEDTPHASISVDESLVREGLTTLSQYAAQKGVCVLFETNGIYADTYKMAELMESVGNPALGVLWDVHHPYRFFGESPEQSVDNIGQWIRYIHLKDSIIPDSSVEYKMLGEGDLPIADAIAALQRIGYDGWYTLEWVRRWKMDLEEPAIVFAHFIRYMHTHFGQAIA